ncbi:MAG: hypothetical protein CSA24_01415 [Deltaproteobacteria bacterium]|nr:MAG: hypothetical protein CSB49_06970 [Pseudomonadota bacterium]PIE65958.1 MAG: hypothetical protein CSA24_01415 [Deltaproteobacteria bacterium]
MTAPRIGNARSVIAPRRPRQTARDNTFSRILGGGAQVLLSGAKIATGLVGLPTLSAAISRARLGTATTGWAKGASGAAASGGSGGASSPDELMKQLQDQRMQDELKLLELQSNIQQQNRQVSLVSNVMKARHDTAKSAISNIRS